MEVYLIRHTTPLLTPGLIYGRSEVLLTENFAQEWEVAKQNLPAGFDLVYSSPALRCTELAKQITRDFQTDDQLAELNFGEWEGKTWDTVDQVQLQLWMDDFVNVCVPGGESMQEMFERVKEFWQELPTNPDQKIAIVTHAGVIRLVLALLKQIPLASVFEIKVGYGEVIKVEI
ncbi:alpha-ribazole phosphatase [Dyadobacter psychrotolerans]|uniref:Alpha-ribazole phosphatase n=1 Tax=Dyadobacter psychrotolerans TaxID=2541721 RepID=A0A4R5DS05_9BACT|nr:alpha-ribazole phosphatase [Dyadobacter psychrotolerans]TDE16487.1 alpha-ribazole phosphatase [Dyadobacter psychrotolerans]